jgi:uncharacterized protein (DUF1697 family)
MTTSVAFLRAVNVGSRSVAMPELRALFERHGARGVVTYIQSGNAVFDPPKTATADFADTVEQALLDEFGFHSDVVVRSAEEIRGVLSAVPFPANALGHVHLGFFKSSPTAQEVADLSAFDAGEERVVTAGRDCYLYLPNGVGRAKLPTRLNRLSVPVTIRSFRTVVAIAELASKSANPTS